jgi:hypothetical protein
MTTLSNKKTKLFPKKENREKKVVSKSYFDVLEPVFKVAAADEGEEAGGAQSRSVHEVLEETSTNAAQSIEAAVDYEDRFLENEALVEEEPPAWHETVLREREKEWEQRETLSRSVEEVFKDLT